MKIALDISPVIYPHFGVGRYHRYLTRALVNEFIRDQFIILGYALRGKPALEDYIEKLRDSGGVIDAYTNPIPVSIWEKVWNRWHRFSVEFLIPSGDVFHASDWVHPPTTMPTVSTVHDLSPWTWPDTFPDQIRKNQAMRMKHVKREARLVLADSEATKQDLIQILDFEPERIRVVHLGVDHERFNGDIGHGDYTRVTRKYGINGPYFISVGTRNPRKNVDRVIRAFHNFKDQKNDGHDDYRLVLVGRHGWGGVITFGGPISSQQSGL